MTHGANIGRSLCVAVPGFAESAWAAGGSGRSERDSGVGVPAKWGGAATLDTMIRDLFSASGNVGEEVPRQDQVAIRDALLDLEARCLPPQREGV
jgi:hypothetical protein